MASKHILIIDDDAQIRRLYGGKLAASGYEVNTAFNGEEALALITKERPALILLDVMMPKMNGVETLKTLKGNDELKDIPVIILTNLGDKTEDVENAKALGALDYLVKSEISLVDLSARVKKVLESGT